MLLYLKDISFSGWEWYNNDEGIGCCHEIFGSKSYRAGAPGHGQRSGRRRVWNHRFSRILPNDEENEQSKPIDEAHTTAKSQK